MKYTKTKPAISFEEFYKIAKPVKHFKSLNGKAYDVQSVIDHKMKFLRVSTGEIWTMDLKGVHQAYCELTDFKTINFKPYLTRTHSPALGLLLHLGLLVK